jgi:hypothetical protein
MNDRQPMSVRSLALPAAFALLFAGLASGGPIAAEVAGDANPNVANLDAVAGAPGESAIPGGEAPSPEIEPEAITEYLHVPGSAFVPLFSSSVVNYAPWGCTYVTGGSAALNFAVELPATATITSVRLYFFDSSVTNSGTLQFLQYDDGNGGIALATVASFGSSGWGSITASGLALAVDYVNYSYVLLWLGATAAGDTLQLCGARIGFVR